MNPLPLISHPSPDAVVAYRDGAPIRAGQFLADVCRVANALPPGRHLLNLCADRYRFAVGFAAAALGQRISLLPSTLTPETVRQMRAFAPDVFCLSDHDDGIDLPRLHYPEPHAETANSAWAVPAIAAEQIVAYVFTSGSTGLPVPHAKTWGRLVRSVRAEAERLGLATAGFTLVGTVPAQHMYGLESSVMLALHNGGALAAGRPFYPADICAALAAVPRPRVLVSTPFHLRILLNDTDATALPEVDLLLSATAPLSPTLAVAAEARFGGPLLEIYGSTETGQIASRRTVATPEWQLFPGLSLRAEDGTVTVSGGHVEQPQRLCDEIELRDNGRFLLHGRSADLINIAGKRTSLAYLNLQLNAIEGVRDGVFFMPEDEAADGVTRLSALVVAPGLSPAELLRALRERIDPVFLPRPLRFVDTLPRNATGKLPRTALRQLLANPGETVLDPAS